MLVLQSSEQFAVRVVDQLRRRKLTSAQYHGGERTALAWAEWAGHHPLARPPAAPLAGALDGDFCAVDLGPGTGEPLLHVTAPYRDRVRRAVSVDVSEAMLRLAAANVRGRGLPDLDGVVADFLADAGPLRRFL